MLSCFLLREACCKRNSILTRPHSLLSLSRYRCQPRLTRPANSQMDRRTPDERCMGTLPSKLHEFEVGWRLDALDYQGKWFPATVVDVSVVYESHGYTPGYALCPCICPFHTRGRCVVLSCFFVSTGPLVPAELYVNLTYRLA